VNTHNLYPISIKHNAPYLAVKSDLRPATAEETAKYKDANKHGRKRTTGTASTGAASASRTTVEREDSAGPSKEIRTKKNDNEGVVSKEANKDRERGRTATSRDKRKESREDPNRSDTRTARETADEKDLAEDESDRREYAALQGKIEARRIAREIQTAHDTLASLRVEQGCVANLTKITPRSRSSEDKARVEAANGPQ